MDIYDYLKKDHEKVDNLFKQFEQTESLDYKKDLVEMIILELTVHSISEEETFYKLLRKSEKSKEEAEHGQEEHEEIQALMAKIKKIKTFNKAWEKQVLELKDLVHHHVKDEEGPMFRKAKKVLSEDEAYMIKEKMHSYKGDMLIELEK